MPIDFALPQNRIPRPSEVSPLASPLESKGLFKQWQMVRNHAGHASAGRNILSQFQQSFQSNPFAASQMHPWKIYQFPSYLRKVSDADLPMVTTLTPGNTANGPYWQRFKVRSGTGIGEDAFGIDGVGQSGDRVSGTPWSNTFLGFGNVPTNLLPIDNNTNSWSEAVIPADGNFYFIWVSVVWDFDGDTALGTTIRYGTDADYNTPGDYQPCVDMWTGSIVNEPHYYAGGYDPYRIPIGWVRIVTPDGQNPTVGTTHLYPNVNQYLTGQLPYYLSRQNKNFATGSFQPSAYVGDWDSTTPYFVGDIVTQTITVSGNSWLYQWILTATSSFTIQAGPIVNIDPLSNTPDPWKLIAKSPVDPTTNTGPDYITAGYDALKAYLRVP